MLKILGNYLVVQHTNFLVDFIEYMYVRTPRNVQKMGGRGDLGLNGNN